MSSEEFEIDDDVNPDPIDPVPARKWVVTDEEIALYQRQLAVAEARTVAAGRAAADAQTALHEASLAEAAVYRTLREKMKLQRVQMIPESEGQTS